MVGLLSAVGGDQIYPSPPEALNCKGWPTTTAVSLPAKANTSGFTFTVTVSLLIHPSAFAVDTI